MFSPFRSFGCYKAKLALFARPPMKLTPSFSDIALKFMFIPVKGLALPGPLNFMAVVFGRLSESPFFGGLEADFVAPCAF